MGTKVYPGALLLAAVLERGLGPPASPPARRRVRGSGAGARAGRGAAAFTSAPPTSRAPCPSRRTPQRPSPAP
jgi:hypothetical protein